MKLQAHRFRAWLIAIAAALGLLVTLALGTWQLSRASYKQALQARIQAQAGLPALNAAEALAQPNGANRPVGAYDTMLLDRSLVLSGRWLPEFTLFLDNRPMQGKTGFYVLTPFQVAQTQQIVVVQRGWVQRNFAQREQLPDLPLPSGLVQIKGRIVSAPSQTFVLPGAAKGSGEDVGALSASTAPAQRIRQNLSLSDFSAETRLPLWHHLLLQTDELSDGLKRDWPLPDAGIEKHYGYAFQWFGLSALIAVLYVWFQLIPLWRKRQIR